MQPTKVKFPDHDLILPLTTSWGRPQEVSWDQGQYEFLLSMIFEEDPAILDYLAYRGDELDSRSPPEEGKPVQHAIGYIDLTVYADLSEHWAFGQPNEMCLFKFGTTGTHMSFLFADSTSIRKSFIHLLKGHTGISGIFDWENDYGELFWFRGKHTEFRLSSNYLLPGEIEQELKRGW